MAWPTIRQQQPTKPLKDSHSSYNYNYVLFSGEDQDHRKPRGGGVSVVERNVPSHQLFKVYSQEGEQQQQDLIKRL